MSKEVAYAVLFYTNRRRENSWKLHRIYESKQEAIDFCHSLPNFKKEYENFVDPVGTIIFATNCGMEHPITQKHLTPEELEEYKQEYRLYKRDSYPFEGLSWANPKVAVMEVPFIKNNK